MTYLIDPDLLPESVPAGQLAALRPGDGVDQARGHGGHHDTHGASHRQTGAPMAGGHWSLQWSRYKWSATEQCSVCPGVQSPLHCPQSPPPLSRVPASHDIVKYNQLQ